jgi:CRISPR-associated protein Cas1
MKLIINSPGTYLCKRGDCFQLQKVDKKQDYSARKIEQILITTRAAMSTDAIELAIENNIDIIFLKSTGQPFGRVWHSKLGSISTIRRKQLYLQEQTYGLVLVKEWILQKINNQIEHLNKLGMNRRDAKRKASIQDGIQKLKIQIQNIKQIKKDCTVDDVRNKLQGYEGTASRIYFTILNELIPDQYKFNGRSKNPAKDPFNSMLNYSYGILYSNVEKACIIAGLDPYIGIMHTDNYNKKALVFDLVEMYRGYMDEIIFKMFAKRTVKTEHFDIIGDDGYYLNQEGKKVLISEYNKEMEKKIRYKGRSIELQNIIQFDCHNIANRILKEA